VPTAANPLKLDDFSGGITDDFIQGGAKQYLKADNLLITNDAKLTQRDGSVVIDESAPQPNGEARIGSIFEFQGELYATVENKIFRKTTAAWTELSGPDSNPGLGVGDSQSSISFATWNNHLFVTTDSGGKVQKVYKDETNTIRLRTAGLPTLLNTDNFDRGAILTAMITRASAIKDALNTHFTNSSTAHNSSDFISSALLPTSIPSTEEDLLVYTGALFAAYDNHFQDFAQEKRTFHDSPLQQPVILSTGQLATTVAPTTLLESETGLNDLHIKMNNHSNDFDIHNNNKSDLLATTNDLLSGVTNGPLPVKSIQHVFDIANEVKAQMNLHFADTNIHSSAETDTITLNDATNNATLMDLVEDIRLKYSQHIENSTIHVAADTANQLAAHKSLKATTDFTRDEHAGLGLGNTEAILTELINVRVKYNAHDDDVDGSPHTAPSPDTGEGPFQVSTNIAASETYNYAFYHFFEYKVGALTFQDNGPVLQKQVSNTAPIAVYSSSIFISPDKVFSIPYF